MAKKSMQMKKKSVKRERNKVDYTITTENGPKSFLFNLLGVLVFIGVMYLGVLGMGALGAFDKGYTKPVKGEVTIDYENILIGTVFNRNEKVYYVLFDEYSNNKQDSYVYYLATTKLKDRVYVVDMSKPENASYLSEESNPKAKKSSDLKINDVTLVKITNGKIANYITGSEEIEKYINK